MGLAGQTKTFLGSLDEKEGGYLAVGTPFVWI